MNTGLEAKNPTVVSAFHTALLHQGLAILVIFLLVGCAWLILRSLQLATGTGQRPAPGGSGRSAAGAAGEPAARRLLRIGFGALWIFDGVLQAQPAMPLGMGPDVIQPVAAASPHWVQHLDNALATVWSYHPVTAAAAAVWIQVGIGVWLLAAPRGNLSRLAGVASVLWGLSVWAFGEAFGGIFAPGLTWLFGAPGAALFYCFAGVLLALPERAWSTARTGQSVLRTLGVFFVGMAVLQAWPGRGFWQGEPHAGTSSGTLTTMIREMAQTPQPHAISSLLSSFSGFVAANGWEVNLFVVIALAAIGVAFLLARPKVVRVAVAAALVLCLADWVLIEDFGFFGGVGTDPNSMLPMALIYLAGYLAITRPGLAAQTVAATSGRALVVARASWPERLRSALSPEGEAAHALRSLAAVGALAVTLVGAVPLALAATKPHADPIIAEAVDGDPNLIDLPSHPFTLTDQHGQPVSLAAFRGKTVALTFLDDVCTSDCPVIAQEFRVADNMLGADKRRVEMVVVNLNPRYLSPDFLVAFDRQEGLEGVPNWLYLTGPLHQLERVWAAYGAASEYAPGGAMVAHSESADVISPDGRIRYILSTDPGPATDASESSFSAELAHTIEHAIHVS